MYTKAVVGLLVIVIVGNVYLGYLSIIAEEYGGLLLNLSQILVLSVLVLNARTIFHGTSETRPSPSKKSTQVSFGLLAVGGVLFIISLAMDYL